jgi:hypothetical protein
MRTRRSFLSRLSLGVAAFAGTSSLAAQDTQVGLAGSGRWQPTHHPQDDWLDQVPGKHRMVIDMTTAENFGQALLFVANYLRINRAEYALQDADLAILMLARHRATAFAFNDAMWAKYGAAFSQRASFNDPTTNRPPTVNVYNSAAHGPNLANGGVLLAPLLGRGVQLAVCETATRTLTFKHRDGDRRQPRDDLCRAGGQSVHADTHGPGRHCDVESRTRTRVFVCLRRLDSHGVGDTA